MEKKKLTLVIPVYNEEKTLQKCVDRVIAITDESLELELILVDDCSKDSSYTIAMELAKQHPEIIVRKHEKNSGKGAALHTGFKEATGDYVGVQDADMEYDPRELHKLIVPLRDGIADVVLGSRFLACGAHRVIYFWHYMGNRFLTFLSNMFTDLNLTDIETCYKVFRRDVIQNIELKEKRFGFEPEIVAKIAHLNLRIYELGISYYGRTYEEGKKIGFKDALRTLYCIFRYNAHRAILPVQLIVYTFIGGVAAIFNYLIFMLAIAAGLIVDYAAPTAFISAAIVNYFLSITILFRHKARWNSLFEIIIYILVVATAGIIDLASTKFFITVGYSAGGAKIIATIITFIFNFLGRRFVVFPEKRLSQ